jgi:hypothetical protein
MASNRSCPPLPLFGPVLQTYARDEEQVTAMGNYRANPGQWGDHNSRPSLVKNQCAALMRRVAKLTPGGIDNSLARRTRPGSPV